MSRDFWSKRKAAVAAETEAELEARNRAEIALQHQSLEEKTDEEILAELELPDPDSLKMGDDFSAFMGKAVPDRIRRRALRTLWRSNPTLANIDGLVDYGEDFTDSATVVENLQTAYQVGKGMLTHVIEMAKQAEEEDTPAPETEVLAEIEDYAGEPLSSEQPVEIAESEDGVEIAEDTHEEIEALPRRRMRFEFENA